MTSTNRGAHDRADDLLLRGSPLSPRSFPVAGFALFLLFLLVPLSHPGTLTTLRAQDLDEEAVREPEPLLKSDVVWMLAFAAHTLPEMVDVIRSRCLTFFPTPGDLRDFRRLGADDAVIRTIRECAGLPVGEGGTGPSTYGPPALAGMGSPSLLRGESGASPAFSASSGPAPSRASSVPVRAVVEAPLVRAGEGDTGELRVRLLDSEDRPVPGVDVWLTEPRRGRAVGKGITDREGRAALRVLFDHVQDADFLRLLAGGRLLGSLPVSSSDDGGLGRGILQSERGAMGSDSEEEPMDLDLVSPSNDRSVTVGDTVSVEVRASRDDAPLQGIGIIARGVPPLLETTSSMGVTDSSGMSRFEISVPTRPGAFSVQVAAKSEASDTLRFRLRARPGSPARVLVAPRTLRLQGRIGDLPVRVRLLDRFDNPVAATPVRAVLADGRVVRAGTTDSAGRVTFHFSKRDLEVGMTLTLQLGGQERRELTSIPVRR